SEARVTSVNALAASVSVISSFRSWAASMRALCSATVSANAACRAPAQHNARHRRANFVLMRIPLATPLSGRAHPAAPEKAGQCAFSNPDTPRAAKRQVRRSNYGNVILADEVARFPDGEKRACHPLGEGSERVRILGLQLRADLAALV